MNTSTSHLNLSQTRSSFLGFDLDPGLGLDRKLEATVHSLTDFEAHQTLLRLIQCIWREKLLPTHSAYRELRICLTSQSSHLLVTAVHFGTLERLLSMGAVWLVSNEGSELISRPSELLELLEPELKLDSRTPLLPEKWEQLKREIENHLENSILLSTVQKNKVSRLQTPTQAAHWIDFLQRTQPWIDFGLFFEQAITRGHPIHPCSKTKLGLSPEDVVRYSPEFHPIVPLKLLAIRKERLHVEAMTETLGQGPTPGSSEAAAAYRAFFSETFHKEYEAWTEQLSERGKDLNDYLPLPVHPWQETHQLRLQFSELVDSGEILVLDSLRLRTAPSLSFRTMISLDAPLAPTLKLPVTVQATSLRRTLPIASADATPKLSAALNEIFRKESNFGGRLALLSEPFGLYLKDVTYEQGKHLSMIVRENPKLKLNEGEVAIVLAALFEPSPVSGLPLLIELVLASGAATKPSTNLTRALRFFEGLCDLAVGSYLKLYLKYGVTLYGHQQNTLVVIRDGKVVRLIARDLEDVYIHEPTFASQGYHVTLHPKSAVLWKDREPGRNTLLHSVFQLHLGEVVLSLSEHFSCDPDAFWALLSKRLEREFDALESEFQSSTREFSDSDLAAERKAFLESPWPCKTLLKMRLQRHATDDSYVPIANPCAIHRSS